MCGIVGYIGPRDVVPMLLEGLPRLEYRGYDSAGIAVAGRTGDLQGAQGQGPGRRRWRRACPRASGGTGIAHTRWATHGAPSDENAHPHVDRRAVAVVHNGIIENAAELRAKLEADGVVLRLRDRHRGARPPDRRAVQARRAGGGGPRGAHAGRRHVRHRRDGRRHPGRIVVARNGCPVVLGIGEKEMFVASDVAALVRHTRQVVTWTTARWPRSRPTGSARTPCDAQADAEGAVGHR